jgi:hypothetical protein
MSSFFEPKEVAFDREAPHTVVVLGPPRSGTSMVSGILRLLGVYMGACNTANNEDPRFNKKRGTESIRALIAENNATYPVWGWKEPSTHIYYDAVSDLVRTPFFIGIYRNILGSASSKLKHTGDADLAHLAGSYAVHYQKISKLLNRAETPCLYVNYDKVLSDPVALASYLSERLKGQPLAPDMHDRIARYCAPGEYKSIEDFL